MSMTIGNEKFIRFSEETERAEVVAEIYVDTVNELPSANSIKGKTLHQGSVAYIIRDDSLAVLDGNGNWYVNDEVIS